MGEFSLKFRGVRGSYPIAVFPPYCKKSISAIG